MPMRTSASFTQVLLLGLLSPLSAQNLTPSVLASKEAQVETPQEAGFSGKDQVPTVKKVEGQADKYNPFYVAQDVATLDGRLPTRRNVESVVDLDVLREPSPFRNVANGGTAADPQASGDAVEGGLALISAVYRETGRPETSNACPKVSLAVEQQIKLDPARIQEIVEAEISANPSCACEIVKAAIRGSDADVEGVVAIVETAINAAPETMRIVTQCAIATVPESVNAVQALLARLDPAGGESDESAKSAKSSKDSKDAKAAVIPQDAVAALANPLDFPGRGPVGPFFGNPTGQPIVPLPPPVIIVPPVTDVNP